MAFALLAPKPSSHPFYERQLSLKEPVKIGRAVAKAKSSNNNGIFDCKVLSRNHAVMWYENGKFMLQDTKSSNGTYVNSVRLSRGSEESEPCEIKSGDTLQFGVEVVENSKNVTHGCIIGMVTLFNEDGTEATSDQEDSPQGLLTLLTGADQNVLPQEIWQLAQFLQDALHREQMLENKLATLQRMIGNCHVAAEDTFQGFIQEDKLLSRLETLENQLEIVTKEVGEDESMTEKINYQDERLQYESSAKETLQRILKEKIDVLQKCGDLERLLSNSEDEYGYLKSIYDKSQDSIQELMEKNKQGNVEIHRLKEELTDNMKNHENIEEEYAKKVDELKLLLEEAEKRGSSAAVEVESLQAECDFTKKQLQAMKERYELLQERCVAEGSSDNGDMDRSGHDLPFASENATLEKDVKNKSAYIQTLKVQLADVMSELERERAEVQKLKGKTIAGGIDTPNFHQIVDLQDKLVTTKDLIINLIKNIQTQEPINLACSSWNDLVDLSDIQDMSSQDQSECYRKTISSCNKFLDSFNGDLQNISMVTSLQEPVQSKNDTVDSFDSAVLIQQESLSFSSDDIHGLKHQETLVDEPNNTALDDLLQGELSDKRLHEYISNEQHNKPLNTICLQVAKQLATKLRDDERKEQTLDSVKSQVQTQNLREENNSLKIKITSLLIENNNLKKEYIPPNVKSLKNENQQARFDSEDTSYAASILNESLEGSTRDDDLQDQLSLSLEELRQRQQDELEYQNQKQNQLVNLVMTLFLLMVIFGALVMLGIVKITPGSLPLLEETTWTDIWESLF